MEGRADFQRLLDDMDKVISAKRQELSELDDRLESARGQLSEREATELLNESNQFEHLEASHNQQFIDRSGFEDYFNKQKQDYEKQLDKFSEELVELESINKQLRKENQMLTKQVLSIQTQFNKANATLDKLHGELEEVKGANLELNFMLSRAESESKMHQKLLRKNHQEDEILLKAFNDKLESMQNAISLRDEEIKRLKSENQLVFDSLEIIDDKIGKSLSPLQQSSGFTDKVESTQSVTDDVHHLIASNLTDERKKQVLSIFNLFKEKNSQIDLLKSQLERATNDLERNSGLLNDLSNIKRPTLIDSGALDSDKNDDTPLEQRMGLAQLLDRCKILENELEAKDRQLHLSEFRNHHLEIILPNKIVELLNEVSTYRQPSKSSEEYIVICKELRESLINLFRVVQNTQTLLDLNDELKNVTRRKDKQIGQLVDLLNGADVKPGHDKSDQAMQLGETSHQLNQDFSLKTKEPLASSFAEQEPVGSSEVQVLADREAKASESIPENRINEFNSQTGSDTSTEYKSSSDVAKDRTTLLVERDTKVLHGRQTVGRQDCKVNEQVGQLDSPARYLYPIKECSSDSQELEGKSLLQGNSEPSCQADEAVRSISSNDMGQFAIGRKSLLPHQTSNPSKDSQLNDSNDSRQQQADRKTDIQQLASKCRVQAHMLPTQTSDSLTRRLRLVEQENKLLELAMKEILLSIKWSDSQCNTILIDCPSLERLCQLIEARFLSNMAGRSYNDDDIHDGCQDADNQQPRAFLFTSNKQAEERGDIGTSTFQSDIFQLIVLKSELDLLRGQNDQLRADLKSQHQELTCSNGKSKSFARHHVDTKSAKSGDLGFADSMCQTEPINDLRFDELLRLNQLDSTQLTTSKSINPTKCKSCNKWSKLNNSLLECIMRVETRVSISDELYLKRMVSLQKIIKMLEKDLINRDAQLSESRRRCLLLEQQRILDESRMQYAESRGAIPVADSFNQTAGGNLRLFSATQNGKGASTIKSLTIGNGIISHGISPSRPSPIKQSEASSRSASLTISLLQSIIKCLQARLDYKDDYLQHLERLLSPPSRSSSLSPPTPPREPHPSRDTQFSRVEIDMDVSQDKTPEEDELKASLSTR